MNSGSSTRMTNPAAFMADAKRCGSSGSSLTVTSTSALKRGTPYAMTAWAPNTYQRPQSASTLDSAVRSSTAAGGSTREQLGQAHVRKQVLPPGGGAGPIGIVQQCLPAQLVGDAEALQWSAAGYAFGPIGVFRGTRRTPLASHVVTNAAADHTGSVARCPGRVHDSPARTWRRSPEEREQSSAASCHRRRRRRDRGHAALAVGVRRLQA